jgi:hypothetical protein
MSNELDSLTFLVPSITIFELHYLAFYLADHHSRAGNKALQSLELSVRSVRV